MKVKDLANNKIVEITHYYREGDYEEVLTVQGNQLFNSKEAKIKQFYMLD